jgi:hypothetical protein
MTGTKKYFTVRSCISNSAFVGGRGRSRTEIELVARAQDDARVTLTDLLPELVT